MRSHSNIHQLLHFFCQVLAADLKGVIRLKHILAKSIHVLLLLFFGCFYIWPLNKKHAKSHGPMHNGRPITVNQSRQRIELVLFYFDGYVFIPSRTIRPKRPLRIARVKNVLVIYAAQAAYSARYLPIRIIGTLLNIILERFLAIGLYFVLPEFGFLAHFLNIGLLAQPDCLIFMNTCLQRRVNHANFLELVAAGLLILSTVLSAHVPRFVAPGILPRIIIIDFAKV